MENALNLDGFLGSLKRSIRVEENVDWSVHTIDYGEFKQRLKYFARRRSKLRTMLRDSPDKRISDVALTNLLGPNLPFPSPQHRRALKEGPDANPVGDIKNDYVPFVDSKSSDSSQASLVPEDKKRENKRSVMRRVSNVERNEMIVFLTWEMDKVFMFYLSQWQLLSKRLELLQPGGAADEGLGDEILELYAFCVTNIVTVRQILIRYDAFARTFEGTPMLNYYMKQVSKHPTSFRKILHHEELIAIAKSYEETLPSDSSKLGDFKAQLARFRTILAETKSAQSVASSGIEVITDSFIYTLRDWFLLGAFEDGLGLEPAYLTMRGQNLTRVMQQLADWRQKQHETHRPVRSEKQLTGMQVYHLTLNLLSAFLYCMNYYIVEPSSTMYVNRLRAYDAMSGTLIGMLPLGAFLSSIPYSYWTNKSFRHPFIMSCTMLILGNLIYSFADQFRSIHLALAGRFMAGLGAPKCIIRRYMADTTPVSLRTSVNALFGMVVAAGSAMGPAMAILLSQVEYALYVPYVGVVILNGLTLPGYFMACLWLTFGVVIILTFEEPDREGLEEQKQLELQLYMCSHTVRTDNSHIKPDDEILSIFSSESAGYEHNLKTMKEDKHPLWVRQTKAFFDLITLPVRLCLGLLLAKVFTIEALVCATSALSKNRYHWQVQQVGTLGFLNGVVVIPFSILVGRLSMSHPDHALMRGLVCIGCFGLFLLIDISDMIETPTRDYNKYHVLSVGPWRYIAGYFLAYLSIQSFEGVIGSTLSKVIPTALASGTFNSGLLATLVDTFGRACGDLFISLVGFINLRQLMNLLFIPGFCIMCTCLIVIEKYRDVFAV